MRIAVLSRNFSSTGGGAERYAIALVDQLAQFAQPANQHEVHVFAQTFADHHSLQQRGVQFHSISMPMRRPRWINQLWFAYATWRLTRHGFDIVHSHENSWHGNVQTVHVLPVRHTLFADRSGLSLALRWLKVLTSPRLIAYLWLERARYKVPKVAGSRRIVVTSSSLQAVMANTYPRAQAMVEVIAPGIDQAPGLCSAEVRLQARQRLGLLNEGRLIPGRAILFVGNDFRKKGLPVLLLALLELPADIWLIVVGQGEQDAAMRAMVQSMGLQNRVHFVGALQDMETAYQAADFLAHPTLEDTYAMVVLEALAHGLPVVVSSAKYCGISSELTHGLNALLLDDPHDAHALADSIRSMAENPQKSQALSDNAVQFACGKTWAEVAKRYQESYQQALQASTGAVASGKQRWLILAHAFNMDGRAASQTITDKLPHLSRAGIEVVVLSGVSGRPDPKYEHHQLWPSGPAGLRFEARHVLRKHFGSGIAYRLIMLALTIVLLPFMLIEKILRPLESSWSWWFSAWFKGRQLLRQRRFDLIYSTGGAFAAHVAAAALKRTSGVPWLAEVHDPFVVPGSTPHTPQQKMQAHVESLICREADLAIWFTHQALASARRRNPALGDRGRMMLPGVDRPACALQPYARTEKYVIGHFGSLSATRNLGKVIEALDQLLDRNPALRGVLELHVYGGPLDTLSGQVAAATRNPFVRHFGRLETDPATGISGRDQILQRMHSADVLLLLHGIEPICSEYIPSKLYEYLWTGRPVLAQVHNNAQLQKILLERSHRVVLTGDDAAPGGDLVAAIQGEIETLLAQWQDSNNDHWWPGAIESNYTTQASVLQLLGWVRQLTTNSK